jgi:hypothetical protein
MLDVAIVVDPDHDHDDGVWDHELDHQWCLCRDSAISLTPPEECDREHDRDDHDLRDVIHDRDACGRIETRAKSETALSRNDMVRGTLIIMLPSMTNLTNNTPLKEGVIQEESKNSPMT